MSLPRVGHLRPGPVEPLAERLEIVPQLAAAGLARSVGWQAPGHHS